jgi:LPXTG-site transpeptidase (sortase) family protein
MNRRRLSPRPWKATILTAVQLILMGCITLGLFACLAGWQIVRQDAPLADLLPRTDRGERAARTRQGERADARRADEGKTTLPSPATEARWEQPTVYPSATPSAPPATLPAAAPPSPLPSPLLPTPRGLPARLPTRVATRLVIPSLGVDAPVVLIPARGDVWDVSQIAQEVGHLQGTASPGDPSNVVLAGHITLEQGRYGPFKSLAQLQVGETAVVYAGEKQYTYVIRSVDIVRGDEVEVTYPTSEPTLTLITCTNWDKTARRYEDRVVVVGYLAK